MYRQYQQENNMKRLFENIGGNQFKLIKESILPNEPQKLINRDEQTIINLIFAVKVGTGIIFHQGEKSYNNFISIENHPSGDEYVHVVFDNNHDKERLETDEELTEFAKKIASNPYYKNFDYYEYYVVTDDDGNQLKQFHDPQYDDQQDVDYPPDRMTWADIAKHER